MKRFATLTGLVLVIGIGSALPAIAILLGAICLLPI